MQDPNLNEEYDCIYRLYKANVGICNGVGLFGSLADLLVGGGILKVRAESKRIFCLISSETILLGLFLRRI